MICDYQTNKVYLALGLTHYTQFFKNLLYALIAEGIPICFPAGTISAKHVWVRDYMPIQINGNSFLRYVYSPDYLKGYEEYNIVKKEISKVTLGGNEYSKAEVVMDFNGKTNYLYLYVRKLDDNLMAEIEIGGASGKKADYFESLFS